jgi:predicted nucleic acid-binding protein
VLVVDASIVVAACISAGGWAAFRGEDLIAPPLAISETSSALHEARWRGEISKDAADQAIDRLATAPLQLRSLDSPLRAWAVAEELGWAKTYDAEYVALARLLGCRLATLDARLRRGAARIIDIVGPSEL